MWSTHTCIHPFMHADMHACTQNMFLFIFLFYLKYLQLLFVHVTYTEQMFLCCWYDDCIHMSFILVWYACKCLSITCVYFVYAITRYVRPVFVHLFLCLACRFGRYTPLMISTNTIVFCRCWMDHNTYCLWFCWWGDMLLSTMAVDLLAKI